MKRQQTERKFQANERQRCGTSDVNNVLCIAFKMFQLNRGNRFQLSIICFILYSTQRNETKNNYGLNADASERSRRTSMLRE